MWARRLLLLPIGFACFLSSSGIAGAGEGAQSQEVRVRLARPNDAAAVREAVLGARRRLQSPECRGILADFADASGRPLQSLLDASGWDTDDYLSLIGFYDGVAERRCMNTNILAFTTPGSRTVFVCPSFVSEWRRDRRFAEIVILHETLHTLGLGENPPSSREITARVARRCSAGPTKTRVATVVRASADPGTAADAP